MHESHLIRTAQYVKFIQFYQLLAVNKKSSPLMMIPFVGLVHAFQQIAASQFTHNHYIKAAAFNYAFIVRVRAFQPYSRCKASKIAFFLPANTRRQSACNSMPPFYLIRKIYFLSM